MKDNIIEVLIGIRSRDDIENLLTSLMSEGGYCFVPIGNERTNANHIELADEPIAPLVERVTNGIDAVLELKEIENRDGSPLPDSPRAASEKWLNVRGGHLDAIPLKQIHDLSDKIEISLNDSGEEKSPTVIIRDFGIGQHPEDLDKTILSLGGENKIGKHYLCGAYGHGGSSTYAWCDYSIIVSRRCPNYSSEKSDLVGWTIVRKNQEDVTAKSTVYEYLVKEDKSVPSAKIEANKFEFGTHIAHIAYEMNKHSGPASIVGYRLFQHRLFDPILPYWITDNRTSIKGQKFRRALAGNLRRLRGNESEGGKEQVEYYNEYESDLGVDGKIKVRYWVFKIKPQKDKEEKGAEKFFLESYLETRKSRNSVPVTLNGQQQHCLDKLFIRKEAKMPFLSDYILVQVECENLALKRKKDIFVATRTKMREGPKRLDLIKESVISALNSDEKLRRIEEERAEATLSKMDEKSEREVRSLLDKLITSPHLGSGGGKSGTQDGPGKELLAFDPKDPPTFLEFLQKREILELVAGKTKRIYLEMDGPDDLFERKRNRSSFSSEVNDISSIRCNIKSVKWGRICLEISVPKDADPNHTGTLACKIDSKDLHSPLVAEKEVNIVPAPQGFVSHDPPTFINVAGNSELPLHLKRGTNTNISIATDAEDNLLTRLHNPASFDSECTIPGSSVVGIRGLSDGNMRIQIAIPDEATDGTTGKIIIYFRLHDGTVLTDERECVVVPKPPPKPQLPKSGGTRERQEPNYKIVEVCRNDSNWIEFGWDESNVGKYMESGGLLYLYVSKDFIKLDDEKDRRKKAGEGAIKIERMWKRYFAHVAFHLYLCAKSDNKILSVESENEPVQGISNDETTYQEMQRVGQTIILLLRSATDILASDE